MKILVIGGAGYIGSHVVKLLLHSGYSVTVFDNLSTGTRENLFSEAAFIEGDILDYTALQQAVAENHEAIIHLAALKAAGESMESPEKYATNNITGTIHILNAATTAGISLLIFSSSAAVYGEPEYLPIDEHHPTNPTNFYGFTKLEIERLLAWYEKLRGLRFAALRYFNAAGYDIDGTIKGLERNPANLLPVIMEVAAGKRESLSIFGDDYNTRDGTGIRDYIHVTDLAVAHEKALRYLMDEGKSITVNLGSELGVSVYEILETAREVTKKTIPASVAPRRAGDPAELFASSAEAERLLHWKAQYSDVKTLVTSSWEVYRRKE